MAIDVTGDGRPEVIQGSGDEVRIYGWSGSGQPVSGWPKMVSDPIAETSPAAGDIDANGTLDLVVAANNQVTLIDLGVAPNALHWPMSFFDPQHTARYRPPAGLVGDLNQDGGVTVADLQLLVNVLLGTETRSSVVARADLDTSGSATTTDLQRRINILLGL